MAKLGRNDPCHCGSGRKYKQCCLAKDEAAERAARAKAAEEAAAAPAEASVAHQTLPRQSGSQPKPHAKPRGFQRMSVPRKVGSS